MLDNPSRKVLLLLMAMFLCFIMLVGCQLLTNNDSDIENGVGNDKGAPGEQTSHHVNGINFQMRLAPAATFPSGVDDNATGRVDHDYWVAETQLTYELWYTVRMWANSNGYTFGNAGGEGSDGLIGRAPSSRKNEPVTKISWYDSIVWCNALSEYLNYDPVYTYQGSIIRDSTYIASHENAVQEQTNGFRLLTGDEWELAARYKGNDSSHGAIRRDGLYWTPGNYASGATASAQNVTATKKVAWFDLNRTKDVGLKTPNTLNLYDMSGNVYEWCFTKAGSSRLVLGGAWFNWYATWMRIGLKGTEPPDSSDIGIIGIRLARTWF